jgi:hypothetical protein
MPDISPCHECELPFASPLVQFPLNQLSLALIRSDESLGWNHHNTACDGAHRSEARLRVRQKDRSESGAYLRQMMECVKSRPG